MPVPLPFRAVAAGFAAAEWVIPSALLPSLDPATLMQAAKASPSAAAIQGLLELTAAMQRDTRLTMFGRLSTRWDFLRLLRNAEAIEEQHRLNPQLAQTPVTAPIFILGLPRSGTTFLHGLMAEDRDNLVPRNWQTLYPAPRPPDFAPVQDRRARQVDRQLKFFAGIAPEFPDVHPIHADSPQECSEITAHVFQSLRFDTTFRVPGYRRWLDTRGHHNAFAFHKKFLQVLQHGLPARRWVLKCPDHIFSMEAILATYPDARFILVHRDPIKVFGSVAHLTEVLRRPFVKHTDAAEIGAQVTERWIDGAARLVAFDQRADVAQDRRLNIHYDDLTADPAAMIRRIYQNFNLPLTAEAMTAVRQAIAANPRGGYGEQRRYALGRFAINPDSLGPRLASYLEYFGILPQAAE